MEAVLAAGLTARSAGPLPDQAGGESGGTAFAPAVTLPGGGLHSRGYPHHCLFPKSVIPARLRENKAAGRVSVASRVACLMPDRKGKRITASHALGTGCFILKAGCPRAMSLINTAVGLLAISSPIGVLPVVARAAGGDDMRLRQISRMAVLTFLFTLLAACWWGQALLDLFAITLDSFRVAGGLILLPIGLRLIEGLEVSHPDVETDSGSLGVVPIGLPLLAGPGAISLVVADSPPSWPGRLALSGVIILLAMAIYLILRVSMPLRRALGELQEKVISRLMGLLLSAIGVQMLVGGLKGCFPVLGTG